MKTAEGELNEGEKGSVEGKGEMMRIKRGISWK
jgi:hypothetical protein